MATNAFVLKSIELENWKTFSNATLNLQTGGITGIVGENGAGKSSFVDAILWALYGSQPKDVTKEDLRRRKSDFVKDLTSVRVTFEHAGQTVEVYRQMKGKNSTVSGTVFLDGINVTEKTGSTVKSWIIQRLGMDEYGFRTAVVVPQKELDSLVDAVPAKRRENIEHLAGVEEMNKALKAAREEENKLAREVKVLPGSVEEAEEAEEDYQNTVSELQNASQRLSQAESELSTVSESLEACRATEGDLQKDFEAIQQNKRDRTLIQGKLTSALNNVNMLTEMVKDIENKLEGAEESNVEELRVLYGELNDQAQAERDNYTQQQNQYNTLSMRIAELKETISKESAKLDQLTIDAKELDEDLAQLPSVVQLANEKRELENKRQEWEAKRGSHAYIIKDRESSIALLSNVEKGAAHCPTCASELADPVALLDRFREERSASEAIVAEADQNLAQIAQELAELNAKVSKRESTVNIMNQTKSAFAETKGYVDQYTESLTQKQADFDELKPLDKAEVDARIADLEEQKRQVTVRGQKAAAYAEQKAQYDKMNASLAEAKEEADKYQNELDSLSTVASDAEYVQSVEDRLQEVKGNRERVEQSYREAYSLYGNLKSELGVLKERSVHLERQRDEKKSMAAAKANALARLEMKTAVSDLLAEYRKDRIARIAPEMSSTATDLIAQMTNGRFIEVLLSDDFSASVVKSDGNTYDVSELSGGEKSIVALALRISIGTLISNGNAGLLWLDEVLPAQDASRRDAVLATIKELPIHQIVMINHTHEAEDVVDHVVRVRYEEDGSVIEQDD